MMRILQGFLKGRKLQTPPTSLTRPTKGVVKEALFNMIRDQIEKACFLDLFSGSGNIGIEAYSLGAFVTCVENSPQVLKVLRQNIQLVDAVTAITVMPVDVFRAVDVLIKKKKQFSLIFADPPYFENRKGEAVLLDEALLFWVDSHVNLLADSGLLIIESKRSLQTSAMQSLVWQATKRYGDSYLNIFSKKCCPPDSRIQKPVC